MNMKPVTYPEELGISSLAVEAFLDGARDKGLDFHSVMVLRHGRVAVALNWAPYELTRPHTLFSLSKSFCSAAAGFAVAEGLLSYEDKVLDVLADKAPEEPDERLAQVTLRHLLTMSSGLEPKSDTRLLRTQDWVKRALSCRVDHEPGTHFDYNTTGTYLISAMVQKVTGQTVRDYLMPRLFDKLGIIKPQWEVCPMGITAGGYGLHLSCQDIAKFGQLLLQDGVWNGEQVLPAGWVKQATAKAIETVQTPEDSDWAQGYGFQFWRTRGGRYRGDGMFGQICLVDEAQDMVIAVTAGLNDMGAEMDLIKDTLLAGVAMQPASAARQKAVQKRMARLQYALPASDGTGHDLTGSYLAAGNRRLMLDQRADGRLVINLYQQGRYPVNFWFTVQPGQPYRGEQAWFTPLEAPEPYVGSCSWQDGVLHVEVRMPGAPYVFTGKLTPRGRDVHLTLSGAGAPEENRLYRRA